MEIQAKVRNPSGSESTFTDEASVKLPAKHRIALTLEGSDTAASDRDDDGKSSSSDEVTFTLTINNTGTVDLTDVVVQAGELEGLTCQQFDPSAIGKGCKRSFHQASIGLAFPFAARISNQSEHWQENSAPVCQTKQGLQRSTC